MMMQLSLLLLALSAALVQGQRPTYAGSRPIGYPTITTTEGLADRFGEVNGTTSTTQRLPIEANGDRDLVDRLSKLPIDKQPFWLINWQALESNREKPMTYPQKPNPFVDPLLTTGNKNSGNVGVPISGNVGVPNSGNVGVPNSGNVDLNSRRNFAVPSSISQTANANTNLGNRNIETNSNSGNVNAAKPSSASNFGAIADRFSGGIEPNRYYENEPFTNLDSASSIRKPGNTVTGFPYWR